MDSETLTPETEEQEQEEEQEEEEERACISVILLTSEGLIEAAERSLCSLVQMFPYEDYGKAQAFITQKGSLSLLYPINCGRCIAMYRLCEMIRDASVVHLDQRIEPHAIFHDWEIED